MRNARGANERRGRSQAARFVERGSGDRPVHWAPRRTNSSQQAPSPAFLAALEQQRAALSQTAPAAPAPPPTPLAAAPAWLSRVPGWQSRVQKRAVGACDGRKTEAYAALARLKSKSTCTVENLSLIDHCPVNSYSLKSVCHGPFTYCLGMPYGAPQGVSAFWASYQGMNWRDELPHAPRTSVSLGQPCSYSSASSARWAAYPVEDPMWDVLVSTSFNAEGTGSRHGAYDVLTAWASVDSHGPTTPGAFNSFVHVLQQRYEPGKADSQGRMHRVDVDVSALNTGFVRSLRWMRAASAPQLIVCGSGLVLPPASRAGGSTSASGDAFVHIFGMEAGAFRDDEGVAQLKPKPLYTLRTGGEVSVACQLLPSEHFSAVPPPSRVESLKASSASRSPSRSRPLSKKAEGAASQPYDVGYAYPGQDVSTGPEDTGSPVLLLGRRNGSVELWDTRAPKATALCTLPAMVADIQPIGPGSTALHGWLTADIDAHAVITDGRMWGRPRCSFIRYKNTVSRRQMSVCRQGDLASMVCADGIARVWDTDSGRPRLEIAEKSLSSVFTVNTAGLEELWMSTVKGVYRLQHADSNAGQ